MMKKERTLSSQVRLLAHLFSLRWKRNKQSSILVVLLGILAFAFLFSTLLGGREKGKVNNEHKEEESPPIYDKLVEGYHSSQVLSPYYERENNIGFPSNPDNRDQGSVERWWRCVGGWRAFEARITATRMRVFEGKNITYDLRAMYYAHSVRNFVLNDPAFARYLLRHSQGRILNIEPLRVEIWSDYATGIHGLVDVHLNTTNGVIFSNKTDSSRSSTRSHNEARQLSVYTFEFSDNEADPVVIQHIDKFPAQNSRVYFVSTVWKRRDALRRYFDSMEELTKRNSDEFGLCIVDFEGDDIDVKTELKNHPLIYNTSRVDVKVFEWEEPFRKAPALQHCIQQLRDDDIVFIMDVDLRVGTGIFNRLKRYIKMNHRIFAPIVYYSKVDDKGIKYEGELGNWADQGTGIIALYKKDIDSFGGYDVSFFQDKHGFEDTDFFFAAKSRKLQVARDLEPELVHFPHPRNTWEAKRRVDLLECPSRNSL